MRPPPLAFGVGRVAPAGRAGTATGVIVTLGGGLSTLHGLAGARCETTIRFAAEMLSCMVVTSRTTRPWRRGRGAPASMTAPRTTHGPALPFFWTVTWTAITT